MLLHIGSTTYHVRAKAIALGTAVLFASVPNPLRADSLPEGPGKAAAVRVCGKCHSPELLASQHQKRQVWQDTVVKMIKLGAQGSDEEFEAILNYVSTYFGPETPGPVNINTARAVDLEAALLLLRSQAIALVDYREKNGPFQSLADLSKVPGLDVHKLEEQKSRIVF